MNRQRFEELAQAYGGDIARWPTRLRDEASLLAAADPEFARGVLDGELRLDTALDEAPRMAASSRLFEAIVATAPPLRARRRWRLWIAPAGLSAGLAAAAAAGVIVGVQYGQERLLRSEATAQSLADLDVSTISELG